jgi:hypothetical protein
MTVYSLGIKAILLRFSAYLSYDTADHSRLKEGEFLTALAWKPIFNLSCTSHEAQYFA